MGDNVYLLASQIRAKLNNPNMKKYFLFMIMFLIVPSFAYASWWNPFTWSIFSSVLHFKTQTQVISSTTLPFHPETIEFVTTTSLPVLEATTTSVSKSDDILCNGQYWHKCQAGQLLVCPTDSKIDAYCSSPKTPRTLMSTEGTSPQSSPIKLQTATKAAQDQRESELRQQANLLKAQEEARVIAVKAAVDKQKAEEVRQQEIQQQAQAGLLKQQQAQQQRDACINAHYSNAQIQQQVDAIIQQTTTESENSNAPIRASYDAQILSIRNDAEAQISSQVEMSRGGAVSQSAINSIRNRAELSVADLEARKSELINYSNSLLNQQIARIRMNAIPLFQNTQEVKCIY